MCPLYPLHHVIAYGFLLLFLWTLLGSSVYAFAEGVSASPKASFAVDGSNVLSINLTEEETKEVTFYLDDLPPDALIPHVVIRETSEDGLNHLDISPEKVTVEKSSSNGAFQEDLPTAKVEGKFNVSGTLLGFSKIELVLSDGKDKELMQMPQTDVVIHRGNRILDKVFIHVVILLVVITYINMGCAIDLQLIKECLTRPVGPAIGLFCQYLFMPLAAFGLGYALFPSSPELWLGLFISGCAPGGGGSNMWTYLLDGNLDLSITMTLISTLVAFGALPLWIYLLGKSVFEEGYYGKLPYKNIAMLVLGLVVPCGIGILIRRFAPKIANYLVLMLKPLAAFFIVFVMTFGIYANLYMFYFFNWRVIISAFCLPFFGFVFGGVIAFFSRRKFEDIIAISVETGIQNTGLAIGVLKIALKEFSPLDDIGMLMPVAVATMTPLPLGVVLLWKKIRDCRGKSASKELSDYYPEDGLGGSDGGYLSEKDSYTSDKPMIS